jgi:hypothetical protein
MLSNVASWQLLSCNGMEDAGLTELERELLELISMAGEPTTVLDEEMLGSSPGRAVVEATLRGLSARGLLSAERAVNAGKPRRSDGERVYEDDWWDLTRAGRSALGQSPRGTERF